MIGTHALCIGSVNCAFEPAAQERKIVDLAWEVLFLYLSHRNNFRKALLMKMLLQTIWPLDDNREILVDRFPFVIGRRSDSDCALPLAFVSRRHCRFTLEDHLVIVQDLESYNGTFVNGKRATSPLALGHGDELTIGPCGFRVVMINGSADTPAIVDATPVNQAAVSPEEESDSTVNARGDSKPHPSSGESKF